MAFPEPRLSHGRRHVIDLFADDPYPALRPAARERTRLRASTRFWLLTRYEDVSALRKASHSADERNLTNLPNCGVPLFRG